jgi:glycosyltransferase involved in cell wall biosynthesis
MQSGAPVLVADTSSLPEVAGDAAVLLSPTDHEVWAATLQRVWHDNDMREQLRQRGLQRAATFTWQTAAQQTLDLYRRIAQKRS